MCMDVEGKASDSIRLNREIDNQTALHANGCCEIAVDQPAGMEIIR